MSHIRSEQKSVVRDREIYPGKTGTLERLMEIVGLTIFPPIVVLELIVALNQTEIKQLISNYKDAVNKTVITRDLGNEMTSRTEFKCNWLFDTIPICYPEITASVQQKVSITFEQNRQADTRFNRAEKYELVPGVNVPSDEEIRSVVEKLEKAMGKDPLSAKIHLTGEASPEGSTPESLVGTDPESLQKNTELAMSRANYVAERLKELNPEMVKMIEKIIPYVKTLSQDEVGGLLRMAERLSPEGDSDLTKANNLVKLWNSNSLELTPEEEEVMQTLFSRKVTITAEFSRSGTMDKLDEPIIIRGDMYHWRLVLIVAVGLLASSIFSIVKISNNPEKRKRQEWLKRRKEEML